MPLIRQIVGFYVTVTGSHWEDCQENTDLRILKASGLTISCRLRKHQYFCYRHEFTLRTRSRSGAPTEFDKVKQGFGDRMFYGIANQGDRVENGLLCWSLIDLNAFRYHMIEHYDDVFWTPQYNLDGTQFGVFQYHQFAPHPPLLQASYNLDGRSTTPVLAWDPQHPGRCCE